jgi:hypothetical protein
VCPSFGPWLCPSDNFPDSTSDCPSDGPDFCSTFSRRGYCKNNDHVSLSVQIYSDIRLLKISCNYLCIVKLRCRKVNWNKHVGLHDRYSFRLDQKHLIPRTILERASLYFLKRSISRIAFTVRRPSHRSGELAAEIQQHRSRLDDQAGNDGATYAR